MGVYGCSWTASICQCEPFKRQLTFTKERVTLISPTPPPFSAALELNGFMENKGEKQENDSENDLCCKEPTSSFSSMHVVCSHALCTPQDPVQQVLCYISRDDAASAADAVITLDNATHNRLLTLAQHTQVKWNSKLFGLAVKQSSVCYICVPRI